MSEEDWKEKWLPALEWVGKDLSDGATVWGADRIEPGIVRRYVEPLELGSVIHHDEDAARALGYEGIVSPATAIFTFSIPAFWSPGEPPLFVDPARDSQPARSPINNEEPSPLPKAQGFFATDIEMEFLRPVVVGERVGRRGNKLLSVDIKETSVGRGAFLKYETEVVSDRGDVVARQRLGVYAYDPKPKGERE